MPELTILDNGLRVVTDAMPGIETATLGLWVGVGTRHEEEADNGVAHLVEHMLFKGTPTRNAFAISAEMEDVGGHLNAYTTREVTAYYAKIMKDDVPLAADILSDMLLHSTLDETELGRERGVIIQEIGQSIDQPDDILFDHLQKACYPGIGLGRPVLGLADIIRSIPRARLQHYIAEHYAAPQIVLAASGAVEHGRIVELAHKHLSSLGKTARSETEKAVFTSSDVRENRDIEQLHMALAFKGVSYHSADYYALSVLSTLLGGGMSSRLFQEIREKRGLVYSIYSFVSAYQDDGQFGIYAGTDPDRIDELLPVVAEEMHKASRAITPEELARAKAQLRSSLFMAQESTMSRAERAASNLLAYGRFIGNDEILQKIDAVTVDDITRLIRGFLATRPSSAFVGPLRKVVAADRLAPLFAA